MDLLSGLRKGDTSRGGRAEFKWEDVKEDKDRENYLGHSLMAPVGRWQKGKDLTWYARSKSSDADTTEEAARKEEIRRIKEAEQDALSEALGFKVVRRHRDPVSQEEISKAIKESNVGQEEKKEEVQGVGFGKIRSGGEIRREEGRLATTDDRDFTGSAGRWEPRRSRSKDRSRRRRDRDDRWRRRSRSRSRRRERWDGDRDRDRDRDGGRRDRDRSRDKNRGRRDKGRSGTSIAVTISDDRRDRDRDHRRHRSRSRSPRASRPGARRR